MNRTYTNISGTRSYNNRPSVITNKSIIEKIIELLSFVIYIVADFITNETVVLVTKLFVSISCFFGIFIFMCLTHDGIISFFSGFLASCGLLAMIIHTFKTMF